jgi:anhydro-N-acetylmuramic acid kinase
MSGTSVDGIDAAVVDLSADLPRLVFAKTFRWPGSLREQILALINRPGQFSLADYGRLDSEIGAAFADAALAAIDDAQLARTAIRAIGCHGQTLFHAPNASPGFSLQAGDANRIAETTGITTVADFRRRDIACGGQGAPLVPAFHHAVFRQAGTFRAILNIGGMANLTLLPGDEEAAYGFDTGPGNVLLDAWCARHRHTPFDEGGTWAASGEVIAPLLQALLEHPYFRQAPPKSTGRETFNADWLDGAIARAGRELSTADVQRTLCELTAQSISQAIETFAPQTTQVLVCGGGVHNAFLLERLDVLLSPHRLESTEAFGVHPDWVEAIAFAWLARQTLAGRPANLPAVTGARRAVILGAIYPGATGQP